MKSSHSLRQANKYPTDAKPIKLGVVHILVALSGGIDSAVAAALLRDAGHEVTGVHLQFWSEDFRPPSAEALGGRPERTTKTPENKCCSLDALETARRLCDRLDIPFYVLNFRESFYENVVADFLRAYGDGQTPNPCVTCNRTIKFGKLLDKMRELGADAVASGHYAQIVENPPSRPPRRTSHPLLSKGEQCSSSFSKGGAQSDSEGRRIFELHRGADAGKDQSYFLHHLGQDKLAHILFPVGGMVKSDVRKIATERKLPHTSGVKESQGACFFPESGPQDFLARHLPAAAFTPGHIVTMDGKRIGTHAGLPRYTVGQRRGVDLGGMSEPFYVVGFDYAANTLIVGPNDGTFTDALTASQLTWVAGTPPANEFRAEVQTRYRMHAAPATVVVEGDRATVTFDEPTRAVTPGQSVVWYDGSRVIGGGTIVK